MINTKTVEQYTRQNTGRHLLDSGDYYGRKYEEVVPSELLVATKYGFEISLTHWLAENATIHGLHAGLYKFANRPEHEQSSWFDIEVAYMEGLGYVEAARDNVYNSENDFDQVFIFAVWVPVGDCDDWVYADNAVISISCHTGCDVRGGYASPMLVTFEECEYVLPLDWKVSMQCDDFSESENERMQYGYSSYPMGELEQILADRGAKIDAIDPKDNCMIAVTDEGITYRIHGDYWAG